jgi:hypothetical protein
MRLFSVKALRQLWEFVSSPTLCLLLMVLVLQPGFFDLFHYLGKGLITLDGDV